MTIRSKIETFMLIAAALSVGVATSAEARGLGGFAPRAVASARVVSQHIDKGSVTMSMRKAGADPGVSGRWFLSFKFYK
jgi:hypothetical protein